MSRQLALLTTVLVSLVAPGQAFAGVVPRAAANSTAHAAGYVVGVLIGIALIILLVRRLIAGRKRP